jgi:hypothetical protein
MPQTEGFWSICAAHLCTVLSTESVESCAARMGCSRFGVCGTETGLRQSSSGGGRPGDPGATAGPAPGRQLPPSGSCRATGSCALTAVAVARQLLGGFCPGKGALAAASLRTLWGQFVSASGKSSRTSVAEAAQSNMRETSAGFIRSTPVSQASHTATCRHSTRKNHTAHTLV